MLAVGLAAAHGKPLRRAGRPDLLEHRCIGRARRVIVAENHLQHGPALFGLESQPRNVKGRSAAVDAILDVLTMNGAPAAYNKTKGAGAGISWAPESGFRVSASYVAANGAQSDPREGGIGTDNAASAATLQLGWEAEQWRLAALYSKVQNGNDLIGSVRYRGTWLETMELPQNLRRGWVRVYRGRGNGA